MLLPGIAASSSIEETKRKLHMDFLAAKLAVDLRFESLRYEELSAASSYTDFRTTGRAFFDTWAQVLAEVVAGVPVPPGLLDPRLAKFEEEVAKVYRLQVSGAAKKNIAEIEFQEKQKKSEEKALETAASLTAQEALQCAFTEFLQKQKIPNKVVNHPKFDNNIDYSGMASVEINPPSLRDARNSPNPKNGQSPGAARGSPTPRSRTARARARRKARARATERRRRRIKSQKEAASRNNPKAPRRARAKAKEKASSPHRRVEEKEHRPHPAIEERTQRKPRAEASRGGSRQLTTLGKHSGASMVEPRRRTVRRHLCCRMFWWHH